MRFTCTVQDAFTLTLLVYIIAELHISVLCTTESVDVSTYTWVFIVGADAVFHSIALGICASQSWKQSTRSRPPHRSLHYNILSTMYTWLIFAHVVHYRLRFDGEEPNSESLYYGHSMVLKQAYYRDFLLAISGSIIYRMAEAFKSF